MPAIDAFEKYWKEYDNWFEKHKGFYHSELKLLRSLIPPGLNGIEIGVGSGRFALPLGIKFGVEPSERMAMLARKRGINVIKGIAEALPFSDESFDFALMVTTICFLDDPLRALGETFRILKKGGFLLVGFVPRDSILGKLYESKKNRSKFYKDATFFSVSEIKRMLEETGFEDLTSYQTIFNYEENLSEDFKNGDDMGSFVVIKCFKGGGK